MGNSNTTAHGHRPVDPCRLLMVSIGIIITVLTTAAVLAGPEILHFPQFYGVCAACLPPIAAAVLTRRSPIGVRIAAPGLAALIAGPPLGMNFYMPAFTSVAIPMVTAMVLLASKARRYDASPRKDRLFIPMLGASTLLAAVPLILAMSFDTVDAAYEKYVILCFALLAFSVPVIMGCVAAWIAIQTERRIIPFARYCWTEARRCAREQR